MECYLFHQHKSILCVRPIPLVPCRTSGTVQWNTTCPTIGQVGQSYRILAVPPSHLSHVGQVGQSYGILPVPPTPSITTKKGSVASFSNADEKKFPVHGYDIRVASTSLSLFNSDD